MKNIPSDLKSVAIFLAGGDFGSMAKAVESQRVPVSVTLGRQLLFSAGGDFGSMTKAMEAQRAPVSVSLVRQFLFFELYDEKYSIGFAIGGYFLAGGDFGPMANPGANPRANPSVSSFWPRPRANPRAKPGFRPQS